MFVEVRLLPEIVGQMQFNVTFRRHRLNNECLGGVPRRHGKSTNAWTNDFNYLPAMTNWC